MVADIASVATIAKPVPRSPDTRAALDYLRTSGASPIFITEVDGIATIRTGSRVDPRAVVVFWIMAANAKPVVKLARKLAGKNPDAGEARGALRRATVECRAALTAHDVAVARAGAVARLLDEFLSSVRGAGTLREFRRAFKVRRATAMAAGRGFMPYKTAMSRLRLALVPLLENGGKPTGTSLFREVFGT